MKEVSLTLTWLADDLGVIGRHQKPRLVDGKPCGSQTLAWPVMARIQELQDYYQEYGHPLTITSREPDTGSSMAKSRDGLEGNSTPGFEATSSPGSRQLHPQARGNPSLISAPTPNAAEGSSESSPGNKAAEHQPTQAGRRLAIAGGGKTSERQRASGDADPKADLAPPAPKASATNGQTHAKANAKVNCIGHVHAPSYPSTAAAPPPWSPPEPPKPLQVITDEDWKAWTKAMRFCAVWQEAIVRSGTVTSSVFTFPDKKAAYSYFRAHPEIRGFFPLAVAVNAWLLAQERARPKNSRRSLYHVPHSLDPRQFLASMHSGKVEAEVGMFFKVNAWETLRCFFTESELVHYGWDKAKIPVLALEPDDLWENDPRAGSYYSDRHRDPPSEIAVLAGA